MAIQSNPFPLRIDKEVMGKMKIIAKANGRSVNKEIEFVLRIHKDEYEKSNGVIVLSDE